MSVCLPVAYIGPKIGTELAHVTRDSDTTFKVKGQGHRGGGITWRPPAQLVRQVVGLLRHVGYLNISNKLPFDLESGVRVTCDVGYLCANFRLSRPLCSRLRPDERDRHQTSYSIIA